MNKGHNAIDNHVGSRVRMRRLMLDLSQTQLAEPTMANDVSALLSTSDGIALVRAYTRIGHPKLRRAIVALVEQIVAEPAERISTVPDAPAVVAIK